jgi:hypothetical protein
MTLHPVPATRATVDMAAIKTWRIFMTFSFG